LVARGRAFLGIAATEPDAGSDLAQIRTTARKADGNYRISGEKMYISGIQEVATQLPEGGGHVTLVKTGQTQTARSLSLMYVPVRVSKNLSITILDDWGRRGISSGGFNFDEYEIPVEYLIGEENRGFYIAMEGFDYARALISVVCCGAAQSCLEQAVDYIKTRKAFGQPIGKFEGIQFKLAEHWSRLKAARWLGYRALWMYGNAQREKNISRRQVTQYCAAAKLNAVPAAFEAINDALQWFGAYGFTTDCPLELSLKAVRSYYWAEGSLEIMKIIVGRELLGREYVCYR
jgi:acyl-CoA dehydrogenase